jgi:MtN3 and saliva related transmembrane protein
VSENLDDIIGIAAGIFTSLSLLPQLIKLIRDKKAEDISLFYLVILIIGISLWIWYGFLRKDIPIIATNSFSLILNMIVIIFSIKLKKK